MGTDCTISDVSQCLVMCAMALAVHVSLLFGAKQARVTAKAANVSLVTNLLRKIVHPQWQEISPHCPRTVRMLFFAPTWDGVHQCEQHCEKSKKRWPPSLEVHSENYP